MRLNNAQINAMQHAVSKLYHDEDVAEYERLRAFLSARPWPFGLPSPRWLVAKHEMMIELERRIRDYKMRYPDG